MAEFSQEVDDNGLEAQQTNFSWMMTRCEEIGESEATLQEAGSSHMRWRLSSKPAWIISGLDFCPTVHTEEVVAVQCDGCRDS